MDKICYLIQGLCADIQAERLKERANRTQTDAEHDARLI